MNAKNPFHDDAMEPVSLDIAQGTGGPSGLADPSLGAGCDAGGAMKVAVEPPSRDRIAPFEIETETIQPSGILLPIVLITSHLQR